MKVAIFGLGYVGAVTGACLASLGHSVIGVDPSTEKLRIIRDGRSPIMEPGLEELVKEGVNSGLLRVAESCDEAVEEADISLICVGTPSSEAGALRVEFLRNVATEIGTVLRRRGTRHLIVVRSTVLPGTTESVAIPLIEEASGKTEGDGFGIAMHPEFLREGSSISDFFNPPMTVIGTRKAVDFESVCELYKGTRAVGGGRTHCGIKVAEAIKYACNILHAAKITYANEVGMFCKSVGVDSRAVLDIVCQDSKLNISPRYLKPGFAFGGSCLPKDLRAYINFARKVDVYLPMFESILKSNTFQIEQVAARIRGHGRRKVSMLGLSFKEATDDLRESPLVHLAEILIGRGYDVRVFDPNVKYASLFGSNKEFIDRELPHLKSLLVDADAAIDHAEVIVCGHNSREYKQHVSRFSREQVVVDLANLTSAAEVRGKYEGLYW